MPDISSIPNGEKRTLKGTGQPVIFDKETGNVWTYDAGTNQLGNVMHWDVNKPGGQTENTLLEPAASTGGGGDPTKNGIIGEPSPTPTASPTFAALAMPKKVPNKAVIKKPVDKKKKENNVMEQDEDAYLTNEWDKSFLNH